MAFSTRRGRPRNAPATPDFGTAELRLKHALGITSEPIDLCLARAIIRDEQHRAGLHFRWLHTLRYGAPRITTRYDSADISEATADDPIWRAEREREYADAVALLRDRRRHDCITRLVIANEMPRFLNLQLMQRALQHPSLETALAREREHLIEGLMLLADHWKREKPSPKNHSN